MKVDERRGTAGGLNSGLNINQRVSESTEDELRREWDRDRERGEREREGETRRPGGNAEPVCDLHACVSGQLFAGV